MKIAQVSPLTESVPPRQYGGTERVISYLTEELVRLGHEVTLFASGDSMTGARLDPGWPRGLRQDGCSDQLVPHMVMLERICRRATDFDVIHFHTGYLHFPLCRRIATHHLTTHHGRLDYEEWLPLFREFRDLPAVSISNDQRRPVPWVNWLATVYHGIPADRYKPRHKPGKYLAFVGRISPEKRLDRAIEIALAAGMEIKIAAKVDRNDVEYFESRIKRLLAHPLVEYVGEINDHEKDAFIGEAYALLFPIDWPEPFGLVMVESMACGTPVIAYRRGSVPEVMEEGVTGFIVQSRAEAVTALERTAALDRRACRRWFEEHFTAERMARNYLAAYELLQNRGYPVPKLAS